MTAKLLAIIPAHRAEAKLPPPGAIERLSRPVQWLRRYRAMSPPQAQPASLAVARVEGTPRVTSILRPESPLGSAIIRIASSAASTATAEAPAVGALQELPTVRAHE